MVSKDEWDTKEGPLRMHCMYSSMAKGTSRDEAMSNSKPIALAVIELRLSEGIRQ